MNFINPFDLLELDTIDSEAIKKSRRRKLADIELNDGFLDYGNHKVSKSDFIKLVDQLDDDNKKMMYLFIKKDVHLNRFLLNNDIGFFYYYKPQNGYENPDFLDFISPYFAESFNVVLSKAFKTGESNIVKKLFSVPTLVNHEYVSKLYQNLTRLLVEDYEKLKEITLTKININSIETRSKLLANVELLNSLPDYFQKQRNDIASELKEISIRVYNFGYHGDSDKAIYYQTSYNIICHAQQLKIDGIVKATVQKEVEEINVLNEKEKNADRDKPILEKWRKVLLEIDSIAERIDNKSISSINNVQSIIENVFSIIELNNLPLSFIEINNQIALSLKNLSASVWNHYADVKIPVDFIELAQKIKVDDKTSQVLIKNKNDLVKVILNYQKQLKSEKVIEEWGRNLKSISDLIESIDNKSMSISNSKNILSQLKNNINISVLNKLSGEYDELRIQMCLVLRSLSISVYNAFEDTVLAKEIIKFSQVIKVDTATYNNLADAYNQLEDIDKKNIQRIQTLQFNTDIRGDVVSINPDKVFYKNKFIVTKDIYKIRFGVYIQTINGIRTSYYTICYGDKIGNFITIECNRLLNSTTTVENQYRQILDATYNTVIPCVLKNIENTFKSGRSIEVGNLIVNKEGITYKTGSLFWKEDVLVKWKDVSFSSYRGHLNIKNKINNNEIGSPSFRDAWNAVILELIKEHIIGIKG